MADVQVALPIPIPASLAIAVPAAVEPEPVAVIIPSPGANAPVASSPTPEHIPTTTTANATIPEGVSATTDPNETIMEAEEPVMEPVPAPEDAVTPVEAESAQVDAVQDAGGEEIGASQLADATAANDDNGNAGSATNDDDSTQSPTVTLVPNFDDLFPFNDEEDIDLGPKFEGQFYAHTPVYENLSPLPYNDMGDEELPEVVKGNFAMFFQMKCGHEFYRNYVRGNTMRRLRTAKDSIQGKPGSLQGILQLPIELLFDILELAHPMDLLHLSRTSKDLRKAVLNKRCEPVWKAAYDNYDEIYGPPEDVPHPKWTAMMYDDARCDFCGDPGALLDFALGEHYCEKCQNKYLIEQSNVTDVTDECPRMIPTLFQLLPATYRQSGGKYQCYYESDSNARYRRTDVEKMIEELRTWFMTIDEGMIPEAGQKFEEWCEPQIKKARTVSDYAQHYNNWATNFYYNLCTEMSQKQRTLADLCMKRFAKLGWDEQDTIAASSDVYYYFRSVEVWSISPKTLEKHKNEIILKIESQKLERMKRERRVIVDKTYDDYKKTLKPENWARLPPSDIIVCDDIFSDYIHQHSLTDVKDLDVPQAMARLPEAIETWHFNRQKELYDLLPGVEVEDDLDYVELDEKEREGLSEEEVEKRTTELRKEKKAALKMKMDERMKLARTMFSCISCKSGRHSGLAVFGWKDACVHMAGSYSHYFHSNWEFCSVGYAAASSLISQLGLDPDTATLEEVDGKGARFLCMNCPTKPHKRVQGRKAYTWRECVMHAVEKEEDHTHAIPTCLLLSDDATSFIKAHEVPHPSPRRTNWSCNHCPEHLETAALFKDAVKHVKETHAIEKPMKGVDVIFLDGRYERHHNGKRRVIFHYGVEPTCHLICKLCRPGKVQRLWTIQALVPHLFHRHAITMPRSTRDYSKIEVFAT